MALCYTCPSEKLVETGVSYFCNYNGGYDDGGGSLKSMEGHVTAATKNRVGFDWIMSTGCLLHQQKNSRMYCESYQKNQYSLGMYAKK
jgi:hypothetical protein